MGRTLADDLASDIVTTHLDADRFGETVMYIPAFDPVADQREIDVIKLEANGGNEDLQYGRALMRRAVFHIAESATLGVLLPADGDIIVSTEGGQSVRWAFSKIVSHAAGLWSLEFQRGTLNKQGSRQAGGL